MKPAQIVLIEDNPADVYLINLALKEHGIAHVLTHFDSGDEALQTLCSDSKDESFMPDAILVDLNTPGMDGFDVLKRLKEFCRFSDVPMAILTSSRDRRDKQRAQADGARYIEKPSKLNEFLSGIAEAVKEMLSIRPLK